jgi:rhodanese-related sulfurtransferase
VLYCWGPACNGASQAATKLAAQGFRVKEMLGGIEYWRKEGGNLEGTLYEQAPLYWKM